MHSFNSDNTAGLCPEAREAIIEAAGEHLNAYGTDPYTAQVEASFRDMFGPDTRAFLVTTGTAANILALRALTEPWQHIVCHDHAHVMDAESTGPERMTGCRLLAVPTDSSMLTPDDIARAAAHRPRDVHRVAPGVVTISNPTEMGRVYGPRQLQQLCAAAHENGYAVHVDGARFGNAVASARCEPAALAAEAGVDALTFGGTKGGLGMGEAVLFFPQPHGRSYERAVAVFPYHRKATGHLLSKHRYVSAPFAAVLQHGAWLKHAAHANAMASRLSQGLEAQGQTVSVPTEANGVFLRLADHLDRHLRDRGHDYNRLGDPQWCLSRFMCSFDTTRQDVDALLEDIAAAG